MYGSLAIRQVMNLFYGLVKLGRDVMKKTGLTFQQLTLLILEIVLSIFCGYLLVIHDMNEFQQMVSMLFGLVIGHTAASIHPHDKEGD